VISNVALTKEIARLLYIKIAGQMAALLIAVIALFGETAIHNKLTKLGKGLLVLSVWQKTPNFQKTRTSAEHS
jgi:hypothetical protein